MSYKAGTVTTVANNATITGINTQWANTLYNVVKGQIIVITQGTNTDIYTIEEIKSNTSLLLSRPAIRAATNATYEILTTLNNSVSDDTIKLGNEIVAMSDFMRIMQAWTTGTGDTITVNWGSQQITMASVAGLQKQIDSKYSRDYQPIPNNTNLDTFYETGFWSQPVSANAKLELGYPTQMAGWLDIYPTTANMCRQEYLVYNDPKRKYVRVVNTITKVPVPWALTVVEGADVTKMQTYVSRPIPDLIRAQMAPDSDKEYLLLGPADAANGQLRDQTYICGTIVAARGGLSAANRCAAYDILYSNAYNAFYASMSSRNGTMSGFVARLITAMYKGIKCLLVECVIIGGGVSSGALFSGTVISADTRIKNEEMFTVVYEKDLSQISQHSIPRMMVDAGYVAEGLNGKFDKTGGQFNVDGEGVALRNVSDSRGLTLGFRDKGNVLRGYVGFPDSSNKISLTNHSTGKILSLLEDGRLTYDGNEILKFGDFGVGSVNGLLIPNADYNDIKMNGFYAGLGSVEAKNPPPQTTGGNPVYGAAIMASRSSNEAFLIAAHRSEIVYRYKSSGVWDTNYLRFYTTANTTKDSNGNLKASSPVVKLFTNDIKLNEESEGVKMEHLGVGHYLIKGVMGFNADGSWGINNGFVIPQDHNGKNMVLIDYEVRPNGDIEVFVFHQQNADMPERFQNKRIKHFDEEGAPVYFENYEPCDVPESRWIDMRVEMPVNSLYNKRMKAAERARLYTELTQYQQEILNNNIKQLN